jgi:hypothetical protein
MSKKIPPPRKGGKTACSHPTTKRKGPYTIPTPKGPLHAYYQVWCTVCNAYLRNEDA